jgi:tetratricopeptide (TPR) repeat protein
MSEMLGNQYFLGRDYARAAAELNKALKADTRNKGIRRKLVICFTQIGDIGKALDTFISLIKEDVEFVINTDPISDDCPCPELVFDMEQKLENSKNSIDFNLILGMLWLYCNVEKSLYYFNRVLQIDSEFSKVKIILALINAREVDKEEV